MVIFQLIQKPQKRGAEIFAAQLSEELSKLGHRVYLISLFEGSSDLPFSGEILHLNRPLSKRWYDFSGWKMLAHLVKTYQPDLIQCNAGDTLKWAVISKILFGWKSLIVARNASTVSSYINSGFTKKINSYLYAKADAIVSVSKHSKNDLNQLFLSTSHKTTVIPIGINNKQIRNVEWKSKKSLINIIHVGGFTFEKNHVGLLAIWESFLKLQPNAILHLFGDGPLRNEIEQKIIENGLQESIFLYGWIDNPIDYIAKADVLVLPSIIEGLPAVILEAMYCKTSVVAYNVGGVSEIVSKETGYLIEKGNKLEFVKAINNSVSQDCSDRIKFAYDFVNRNFNNQIISLRFENQYRKLKKQ